MIDANFFGPDAHFHHVGLAVRSVREVDPECSPITDEIQGVRTGFVDLYGTRIELLEPYGDGSPVAKSVKAGTKLLHLCFEVPDLETAIGTCRRSGFHRISQPAPTPVFEGRRIVWVFSPQFGLFELLERCQPAGEVSEETPHALYSHFAPPHDA